LKSKELVDTLVEFKAKKLNKAEKAIKKAKKSFKETTSKKEIAKAKLDFARQVHNEIS
jgi:predicted lipoprotein